MPTLATNKIVFRAPDKIVELLEAEQARTGASVSEILRRAVTKSLTPATADPVERRSQSLAPVLISKASA